MDSGCSWRHTLLMLRSLTNLRPSTEGDAVWSLVFLHGSVDHLCLVAPAGTAMHFTHVQFAGFTFSGSLCTCVRLEPKFCLGLGA